MTKFKFTNQTQSSKFKTVLSFVIDTSTLLSIILSLSKDEILNLI